MSQLLSFFSSDQQSKFVNQPGFLFLFLHILRDINHTEAQLSILSGHSVGLVKQKFVLELYKILFACLIKLSADTILKYFPYFSLQCQILFSRKNKKNIMSLLSVEFAHSMVDVKIRKSVLLKSYCYHT